MKLSFKSICVLLAASIMYACNSGDKTSTGTTSSDSSGTGSDKPAAMDILPCYGRHVTCCRHESRNYQWAEQDFLNYAVPANSKRDRWLKAGMAKGTLKDIKEHSAMMLKDHKKLETSVKGFNVFQTYFCDACFRYSEHGNYQ